MYTKSIKHHSLYKLKNSLRMWLHVAVDCLTFISFSNLAFWINCFIRPNSILNYWGQKIKLELSASESNISILSCDSRQPIIAKPQSEGGVFKHVRCSDLSNGTCMHTSRTVSDVIWSFDISIIYIAGTWRNLFILKCMFFLINELN